MTKSGAAASSLPKCKFFDEMTFLHEKSCNRPRESNLQLQSTFISPSPSPVCAKFQEKKQLTQWVRLVVYLAKNGKSM